MNVTLRTGVQVNIPERIDELKFRNFIDFAVWQDKIHDKVKELAQRESLDDLDLSAEIFQYMVGCLADVTDSKPGDWMDQDIGDVKAALIELQKDDPKGFEHDQAKLTYMFMKVAEAVGQYEEPDKSELVGEYSFPYFDYDSNEGKSKKDKVVDWVVPMFIMNIFGGFDPSDFKAWQIVEAKEAQRVYQLAMEHYTKELSGEGYRDMVGNATYTRSLVEIAVLANPKGRKLYRPTSHEEIKHHVNRLIAHFRDIPAKAVLDVGFFLKNGVEHYLKTRTSAIISTHQSQVSGVKGSKE